MDYLSTDFGVDSSSCLSFRARTNRQTDASDHPTCTPAAIQPAWVNGPSWSLNVIGQI